MIKSERDANLALAASAAAVHIGANALQPVRRHCVAETAGNVLLALGGIAVAAVAVLSMALLLLGA